MAQSPIIVWFRRDLRLADHPALLTACRAGRPVIPVFIHDEVVESLGAAPKWRLGLAVEAFAEALEAIGSKLILRRGKAIEVLRALITETGATAVYWSRLYDPQAIGRDSAVKSALQEAGIEAQSFNAHLLFEPWQVETQQGGFYKVYSPFWRAVKDRDVATPLERVTTLAAPRVWPASDATNAWQMGAGMRGGAKVVAAHVCVGEAAAADRLASFVMDRIATYKARRDFPAVEATSRLSENLTYGEISPRTIWHAGQRALHEGAQGAEHFLRELVWREFAYHLIFHTPHITHRNWREEWDTFPWRGDSGLAEAWRRGRTGLPFVDAAMRELYVTGTMHNRARMIVASYLTKHLLTDWRIGMRWFEECLIDWDPASNAMGWQWVAGSGPDAAPYFRIFNPETQAAKFDPQHEYLGRWIAEGRDEPHEDAISYFKAVPRGWALSPNDAYPDPVVGLAEGRKHALAAYETQRK
ncbi:MAG: deoxyribodipyrimidine photo-lyase [Paracoccaceae bacterium]